jgi:hypothetical protein
MNDKATRTTGEGSRQLLDAAVNAAATINAIYDWVDRVKAAGGTTSISGVAACHAMLQSLERNRARCDRLIIEPLKAAIEAQK